MNDQDIQSKCTTPLSGEKRETDIGSGGESVAVYNAWLEKPDGDTWQNSKILNSIRDYNIDDCESTYQLTDWLRGIQKAEGIKATDNIYQKDDIVIKEQDHKDLRDQLDRKKRGLPGS